VRNEALYLSDSSFLVAKMFYSALFPQNSACILHFRRAWHPATELLFRSFLLFCFSLF